MWSGLQTLGVREITVVYKLFSISFPAAENHLVMPGSFADVVSFVFFYQCVSTEGKVSIHGCQISERILD